MYESTEDVLAVSHRQIGFVIFLQSSHFYWENASALHISGALRDKDHNLVIEDKQNADLLNNFLASVGSLAIRFNVGNSIDH